MAYRRVGISPSISEVRRHQHQFLNSTSIIGFEFRRLQQSRDLPAIQVSQLGSNVVPVTLQDALKADVVILAVPLRAHTAVAGGLTNWSGKVVVDAMNTYGVSPEELNGQASTDLVASALPGAKLVKTLNQLPAKLLAEDAAESGGRRVMFVSSNDQGAEASIAKLVGELGFAPVSLGKINEGGALIDRGGPLVLQNLIKVG